MHAMSHQILLALKGGSQTGEELVKSLNKPIYSINGEDNLASFLAEFLADGSIILLDDKYELTESGKDVLDSESKERSSP